MNEQARKQIELLKSQNENIEKEVDKIYLDRNFEITHQDYVTLIRPRYDKQEENKKQIKRIEQESVEIGDGVTIHLYSDSHAYTIIKRTAKTITIQRDKATLSSNFKPEFIVGGFAAHCTNQQEQEWTYERDEEGQIETLHWSDKLNGWRTKFGDRVSLGRHEFYDYNF